MFKITEKCQGRSHMVEPMLLSELGTFKIFMVMWQLQVGVVTPTCNASALNAAAGLKVWAPGWVTS